MRIIHKASFVFLLKDIYSKLPITTAVILCNGKQNPYTRKKTGQYVFSNLYPGEYEISINCKGYTSLKFSVSLKENETKEMTFDMSYTPDNQNIANLTRLQISCSRYKQPIADTKMLVKLKNNLSFLKLIEPVEQGSDKLKLSTDFNTNLLGQKYIYEVKGKSYEMLFWSFDQENKSYILKDNSLEKIEPEGKFYPVWELKTDTKGRLTMPVITEFMKDDVLNLELFMQEDIHSKIEVNIKDKHMSGEVFYIDAKFRKIPKRKSKE